MAPLPNGLNLFFVIVTSHLVALSQQQHLQSQQLQVPSSANERDADCWLALGAHRELQFGSNQRHLRRRRLQTYLQPAAATTTTLQRRRLRHQQSSSGRKEGFRVTGNDTAAAAAANLLLLQRQQQQQRNSSRGSGKRTYKRQALAVDLAVNRLHILESLDGQLREFAEAGNQRKQQQQSLSDHQAATSSPSVCQLPLNLPDVNLGPISSSSSSSSTQPERPNHLHHHYHQKHHKHHHQHNNNHHHRNNSNHSNNNNINNNHLPSCLASERLKRQVPPYMLNLQRQLLGEARTLAQAVRLMPYRSLVMRSFRQPVANQHHHLSAAAAAAAAAAAGIEEGQHEDAAASDLVVELNALGAEPTPPTATDLSTNEHLSAHYQQDSFASPAPPPPPVPVARQQATNGQTEPETSCDAKLAEGQLCYWFRISPQLSGKINGSLVRSPKSSSWKRERLVEAELHLFKLLPDLSLSQAQAGSSPSPFNEHISSTLSRGRSIGSNAAPQQLWSNGRDRRNSPSSSASQPPRTSTGTIQHLQGAVAAKGNSGWRTQVAQPQLQLQQHEPRNRSSSTFTSASASSSSSSYHLKTNLLEVSLYQILPRKISRRQSALTDFPLRLLDIRRIDLYSSGWETFYVKRAVEDWVRDANLNLGLVIKAKSMFDEPIKVGLIRFADLRSPSNRGAAADWQANNHPQEWFQKEEEEEEETRLAGKGSRQQQKQLPPVSKDDSEQFDSIHQPILVIYTTTAANADK